MSNFLGSLHNEESVFLHEKGHIVKPNSIYGKIVLKREEYMNFSGDTVDMVGLLFPLIPILLVALLLRIVEKR